MQKKRVALITGSSSGLGKRIAIEMAQDGWILALNSHRSFALEKWIEDLKQTGCCLKTFQSNVQIREQALGLVQDVIDSFGRIDVLVHTVGPFIRERKQFVEYTEAEIQELVNGNLLSSIWLTQAVLPFMRRQQWGRIIYFGFGRAQEAPSWPDRSIYAAVKTALVSLTKTLAVEEAAYGITVNMICPGDIVGKRKEQSIEDVETCFDPETPRGRPGTGEDVARVVRFLCEEKADFLTGSMISVTGGLDVIHPVSKKK